MDGADRESNWHAARVVVDVGSRIRFSVELLQQFYERPDQRSPLCEVESLIREADGTITVWMKRAE